MEINLRTISDIRAYQEYIPDHVLKDVDKRMTDWVRSGGTFEDPYIENQFKYLEKVIEAQKII